MLIDANILLYAADQLSPFHARAKPWLADQLRGGRRVGLPLASLLAFLRISTQRTASARPFEPATAFRLVRSWLSAPVAWIPQPGPRHLDIVEHLVNRYQLRGRAITDVHLAALAVEHGVQLCSADSGFARFTELRWHNPVAPD